MQQIGYIQLWPSGLRLASPSINTDSETCSQVPAIIEIAREILKVSDLNYMDDTRLSTIIKLNPAQE